MANGFDNSDIVAFQQSLAQIQLQIYQLFDEAANELAKEFLSRVQAEGRTPRGKTKVLNKNWNVKVEKFGKQYVISVWNPIEYAEFVEKGHRTRKGKGATSSRINSKFWVEGRFMMKLTEDEILQKIPGLMDKIEDIIAQSIGGMKNG